MSERFLRGPAFNPESFIYPLFDEASANGRTYYDDVPTQSERGLLAPQSGLVYDGIPDEMEGILAALNTDIHDGAPGVINTGESTYYDGVGDISSVPSRNDGDGYRKSYFDFT